MDSMRSPVSPSPLNPSNIHAIGIKFKAYFNRYLDMTVLGKFAVVMADPPWDIHMELPYGNKLKYTVVILKIPFSLSHCNENLN